MLLSGVLCPALHSLVGRSLDWVLCAWCASSAAEERQSELVVEAEEQWDLCRRRSWAERCVPQCSNPKP